MPARARSDGKKKRESRRNAGSKKENKMKKQK